MKKPYISFANRREFFGFLIVVNSVPGLISGPDRAADVFCMIVGLGIYTWGAWVSLEDAEA